MRLDTHRRKIALVLLIVFLTRLPFLSAGFGSDDDAWRVAVAATRLRNGKEYIPSRLPGYPVQEYTTALIVPYGATAVNLLSVLMVLVVTASLQRFCCTCSTESHTSQHLRSRSCRWSISRV